MRRAAASREPVQRVEREEGEAAPSDQADRYPDDDEHARSLPRAGRARLGPVVRAGARRSSGTAATDVLESVCEARASLARRSAHRRSAFASFALIG